MKKTDLKEIRNLEPKQIRERVIKAKKDLQTLVLEKTQPGKGSKDVKAIFKKRKDIAKMMTILRQKELIGQLEKGVVK